MPMYSDKTNAENRITISDESRESIVFGAQKIADALLERLMEAPEKPLRLALETWYGVPVEELIAVVLSRAKSRGITVQCFDTVDMFKSVTEIKRYKQKFITDDPGFGYVNMEGRLEDILDDYTLFLHRGGRAFLRRYREAKGWNRQQLAGHARKNYGLRCKRGSFGWSWSYDAETRGSVSC